MTDNSPQPRYPTAFQTVDVAIFNEAGDKLLMARKAHQDKMRFVGGFSDPQTGSLEDDARREVAEETGIEISDPVYVGSTLIDDARYRGTQDAIKTALFRAVHTGGDPQPADDIAEVFWVDMQKVAENAGELIVDEHQVLVAMLGLTGADGSGEADDGEADTSEADADIDFKAILAMVLIATVFTVLFVLMTK